MDTSLSTNEFDMLIKKLDAYSAYDLPNMSPMVSHAMTYWVKIRNAGREHEACAYHTEGVRETKLFDNPKDKDHAINWSLIVTEILKLRQHRVFAIRPAKFDTDGNVVWNLPASETINTDGIFGW